MDDFDKDGLFDIVVTTLLDSRVFITTETGLSVIGRARQGCPGLAD
jgi:hypothetical protein